MRTFFYLLLLFGGSILFFICYKQQRQMDFYRNIGKLDNDVNNKIFSSSLFSNNKIQKKKQSKKVEPLVFIDHKKTYYITAFFVLFIGVISFFYFSIKNSPYLSFFLAAMILLTHFVPKQVSHFLIKSRVNLLLKNFPLFIDILAACVQTGMTLENSLKYTADNFVQVNKDLSLFMQRLYKQSELSGLEVAILSLQSYKEVEIKIFCTAIQNSLIFGASIFEQLVNLSREMRETQILTSEEKIGKIAIKLTLPIFIFIVIPFIVVIFLSAISSVGDSLNGIF